jgi:hypothetical protein
MMDMLYRLAPSATGMIRADHAHVLDTMRRFRPGMPLRLKQGLVGRVALALDVLAQVEGEIFYPALRAVVEGNPVLERSLHVHATLRRLVGELRGMDPAYPRYDDLFMELMRNFMHHVADEEAVLLPLAERLLQSRLGELGLQMRARRLALLAPRTGDLAVSKVQAMPASTLVLIAGAVAGGLWLGWRLSRGQPALPPEARRLAREALRKLHLD